MPGTGPAPMPQGGAGAPLPPGAGQQPVDGQGEPAANGGEYVSRAELQALEQRIDRVARGSRSMVDKASNDLGTRLSSLQETVTRLEAAGHKVPPEVLRSVEHSMMIEQASGRQGQPAAGANGQEPQGQPAPGQEPGAAEVDPTSDAIAGAGFALMQEYGVFVGETDPEFALINLNTSQPSVFLDSVKAASSAKATRLGLPVPGEEQEPGTSPRARTPAGPSRPTSGAGAAAAGEPATDNLGRLAAAYKANAQRRGG